MPNKDGTGPEGKGPLTGRGRGNCKEKTIDRDCGKPCRGTHQCTERKCRETCKQ